MEGGGTVMEPVTVPVPLIDRKQSPLIELDQVTIYLGENLILQRISFSVLPGKLCVLLGPNGAGKTTLLRCIDGLIPSNQGQIQVLGQNIDTLGRKELSRRISYVPQLHQSVFPYQVKDFVLLGRAPHLPWFSTPQTSDRVLAEQALAQLSISYLSHRNYLRLSGGERQLALLARGLVQEAPAMLLDEPTAHLDFSYQHRIMSTLKRLVREKNLAALVSLHDPNLALEYGDQIVLLHHHGLAADISRDEDKFLPRLEAVLKQAYGREIQVWQLPKTAVVVRA